MARPSLACSMINEDKITLQLSVAAKYKEPASWPWVGVANRGMVRALSKFPYHTIYNISLAMNTAYTIDYLCSGSLHGTWLI